MSHANGKITAPVNTDDVSATIGVASHDVATLCSSTKINPFAKYKPCVPKVDTPITLTDSQRKDVAWGMGNIPYYNNLLSLAKNEPPVNGWKTNYFTHEAPVPGTNFCRLDDFVNYWHDARPFIGKFEEESIPVMSGTNSHRLVFPAAPQDTKQMQIWDLTLPGVSLGIDPAKWYFGIIIVKGTVYKAVTDSSPLSQAAEYGLQVELNGYDIESLAGTVKIIPMIVNSYLAFQSVTNTSRYAIPFWDAGGEVEIDNSPGGSGLYATLAVWRTPNAPTAKTINYRFTIRNESTKNHPLGGVKVTAYNSSGVSLGSVTPTDVSSVAAGSSVSKTGTINLGSVANVKAATKAQLFFYADNDTSDTYYLSASVTDNAPRD